MIGGDFNTITSRSDRKGRGVGYSEVESQDFRSFIEVMNVLEPPCLGKKFS